MKKDNQTVESYYSKIVGKRNYSKFFQYMFNAVPSQPTNDFPANILFKRRTRRKDILKSFTFRNGIKSVIESIADLPGIDLKCGNAISSVTRKNDTFFISMDDNQSFETQYFALATPVNITADLIKTLNPDTSQLLNSINYVLTDSVGIVLKKELSDLMEVAGIIGIDADFYSIVSRDVVDDNTYRGLAFHFKPGILKNEEKIGLICHVLGISEKDLTNIFYKQNAVPSFKLGHESIVKNIDETLQNDRVFITGNYFSGMAIEDCVGRSREEFKRLQNFMK
jgi:protoporphyrinogen oxidase